MRFFSSSSCLYCSVKDGRAPGKQWAASEWKCVAAINNEMLRLWKTGLVKHQDRESHWALCVRPWAVRWFYWRPFAARKKKEKQTVRAGNSSACCRWISVVFRRPLPGVPVVLCRMCSHICPRKWCQNIWEEQPQRDPSPKIENKRNVLFYSLLKLLPLSEPTSTAFNLFDGDQHPEAGLKPDHLHRSRWSQ